MCQTENLSCKLFYCPFIKSKYKILKIKEIPILKMLSLRQKMIIKFDVASTKEEALNDLCSYSFLYAYLKIVIRHKWIWKMKKSS